MAVATFNQTPSVNKGRAPFQTSVGYIPGGTLNNVVTGTAVSGLSVDEYGGPDSPVRTTVLTLASMPFSITDASAYGSQLIYTFPEGRIMVLGCVASLTWTTTSAIASTLNSGVSVQYAVGSAAASATTLATTMLSFTPGTGQTVPTFTSSTTINVASAQVNSSLLAYVYLDGTTTAIPVYLNAAVGTGTDIDGDATLTVTGTVAITWIALGDY